MKILGPANNARWKKHMSLFFLRVNDGAKKRLTTSAPGNLLDFRRMSVPTITSGVDKVVFQLQLEGQGL
jgi:hypothetical protein